MKPERRTHQLTIRLTEPAIAQIRREASKAKVSQADYILNRFDTVLAHDGKGIIRPSNRYPGERRMWSIKLDPGRRTAMMELAAKLGITTTELIMRLVP